MFAVFRFSVVELANHYLYCLSCSNYFCLFCDDDDESIKMKFNANLLNVNVFFVFFFFGGVVCESLLYSCDNG